jgi:hypothetical protein
MICGRKPNLSSLSERTDFSWHQKKKKKKIFWKCIIVGVAFQNGYTCQRQTLGK